MVDAEQIGTLALLFSHYFRSTSPQLSQLADEEFGKRPGKMKLLSLRTHCKILLMHLADGRKVTFESSANARSCDNLENVSVFGNPELHDFHVGIVDSLFTAARA